MASEDLVEVQEPYPNTHNEAAIREATPPHVFSFGIRFCTQRGKYNFCRQERDAWLPDLRGAHQCMLPDLRGAHQCMLPDLRGVHQCMLPDLRGAHQCMLPDLRGAHQCMLPSYVYSYNALLWYHRLRLSRMLKTNTAHCVARRTAVIMQRPVVIVDFVRIVSSSTYVLR